MIKQLVGLTKNVSNRQLTRQKLEAVGRASNSDCDAWNTNPFDALRVDILSSEPDGTSLESFQKTSPLQYNPESEIDSPVALSLVPAPPAEDLREESDSFSVRAVNHIVSKLDGTESREIEKSLGVFSDSRIYSAMIKHEIKQYDMPIKYFNHPNTFDVEHFALFDSISAWIVFLSEDSNDEFLDQFLDRYVDKPTLFLFEKTKRISTTEKIKQFAIDNGLLTT